MFRRRSGISEQHPRHRAVLDGVSVRRRFTASSFRFWGSVTSGRLGRVTVLPQLKVDRLCSVVDGTADFDPNRTVRALPLRFCPSSHPRGHAVTHATDARQSARVAERFADNVPRKTANRVTWPGLPPFGLNEGRGPLLAGSWSSGGRPPPDRAQEGGFCILDICPSLPSR
jgi:hypothetical protein